MLLKVLLWFSMVTQIVIILILIDFFRHEYFELLIIAGAVTLFYLSTVAALFVRMLETRRELKKMREMSRGFEREIEELRIKQHDLKNQIAVVKEYCTKIGPGGNAAVGSFVERMEEQLAEASIMLKFDDSLLSALLSVEMKKAQTKSIYLRVRSNLRQIPAQLDTYDSIELIENLLDNAIDASAECSEVIAEINRINNNLLISVTNDGRLKGGNLDQLFQPGFSTKGKKRGYGLAIVKRIADKNGGNIEVTDDGGKVQFRVSLPISADSVQY